MKWILQKENQKPLRWWFLFSMLILTLACQHDIEEALMFPLPEAGEVMYEGNFIGTRNYRVSGKVQVIQLEDKTILQFIDFSSSSGPDLKVYISPELSPTQIIHLGDLKALNGVFSYTLPDDFSIEQSGSFVLIYCERFSALFGSAELMKSDNG